MYLPSTNTPTFVNLCRNKLLQITFIKIITKSRSLSLLLAFFSSLFQIHTASLLSHCRSMTKVKIYDSTLQTHTVL